MTVDSSLTDGFTLVSTKSRWDPDPPASPDWSRTSWLLSPIVICSSKTYMSRRAGAPAPASPLPFGLGEKPHE